MARDRTGRRPGAPDAQPGPSPAAEPTSPTRRRRTRRPRVVAVVLLVMVAAVLLAGRFWTAAEPAVTSTRFTTEYLVVVGTERHGTITDTDRAILDAEVASTQLGMLQVPTGDDQCAAAGWASLSAGEIVNTGTICRPEVTPDGAVHDWRTLQEHADGQLGMLGDVPTTCVAAVGPGAALGAVRSDGTVSVYQEFESFSGSGHFLSCPLTLVDAPGNAEAEAVIADLAARDNVTLIVAGLGPDMNESEPQLFYRTASTLPGLVTSRDDQVGIVTLPELSAALRDYVIDPTASYPGTVPGYPLQVVEDEPSADRAQAMLDQTHNLADRDRLATIGLIAAGLLILVLVGLWRWLAGSGTGQLRTARIWAAASTVWLAALMAAGGTGWWRSSAPTVMAVGSVAVLWVLGTALALLISRYGPSRMPTWLTGLTVTAGTGLVLAWLNAPARAGSLLDRPDSSAVGLGSGATAATVICLLVAIAHLSRPGWQIWLATAGTAIGIGIAPFGAMLPMMVGVVVGGLFIDGLLRASADNRAYQFLGRPWLTLVAAAVGALAVLLVEWLTAGPELVSHLMILLGLAAWTIVHSWLAPGPVDDEHLDHRGLRVPMILTSVLLAVAAPDPAWAWAIASVTFAVSAFAVVLWRRSAGASPAYARLD